MRSCTSIEQLKIANDIALKWFEIHADQRMGMFRFHLTLVGFSMVGFAAAVQNSMSFVASVVGVLLVASSICFKQLDRRTSQLLKHAEAAMKVVGSQVAYFMESDAVNVAEVAERKDGVPSYRQMFGLMYWFCGLLGLLFVVMPWVSYKI